MRDDPFLPVNGRPIAQVRAGRVDDAVRQVAGDIANVPEDIAAERALAQQAVDWIEYQSPFRPFVTRVILRSDVNRLGLSRYAGSTGVGQSPASQIIAGPSGFISAYVVPLSGVPTPPGDVTWNTNPATAQPHEILSQTSISDELLSNAMAFTTIAQGKPVIERAPVRPDPWIVDWLARSVRNQENVEFAAGAATNADPWRGLANIAGLSTFAAGTPPYIDDALKAIAKLRTALRQPNAVFVSTGLAHIMRTAKETTNAYILPIEEPPDGWQDLIPIDPGLIVCWLRGIPVVELDGLPNGASVTSLYVGDWRNIVMTQRVLDGGILARLAESAHMDFASDKFRYRLAENWDTTLIPNQGSAIYSVTAINSPAP
jgi:Phage capsid family